MAADSRPAGSIGELLAARRKVHFVGRAGEIELFRAALNASEPPFVVLFAHGPGGIGKTSLLEVFGRLAADAGMTVLHLDGRQLSP